MEKRECTHVGSKYGIFIHGSCWDGITKTEHVYICNDCGAIYLHKYRHDAPQGEERTDIIMPGETKNGVTFHAATAALIKLVQDATSKAELTAIGGQATAIRNYVVDRLEELEEEE